MGSLILIILGLMPGVWSGNWRVTFKSQCALKGTSVVIECEYDYPFPNIVTSATWTKGIYKSGQWSHFLLPELPSPPDFKYVGNLQSDCSLRINRVQHADEGAYFFSFVTTLNRWTSRSYALLSVRELTAVVQPSTVTEGDDVRLTCVSGCYTRTFIVWFKDGQRVSQTAVFQARRKDAGRYYCAVQGQETARSASVALNVKYAPSKVTLSMSPSAVKGSSVTFTCSSDANPPVTQSGYSLHKDGHFISSGQNHIISDIQPSHTGLYYCQAWNNVSQSGNDLINSTEVHLDVQYRPENISISVDPPYVVEGISVNMTCSSAANPPADNYIWYRATASSSGSMLQVGSDQVLSLPSVEASHSGLYLCRAENKLGQNNSTEILLAIMEQNRDVQPVPILAGIGVFFFVTLVLALLLVWRKQKTRAEKKALAETLMEPKPMLQAVHERGSSSSEPPDSVYANLYTLPSSPPPAAQAPSSCEGGVTYSTVTIKPRNSQVPHDSGTKDRKNEDSVIYATLPESR